MVQFSRWQILIIPDGIHSIFLCCFRSNQCSGWLVHRAVICYYVYCCAMHTFPTEFFCTKCGGGSSDVASRRTCHGVVPWCATVHRSMARSIHTSGTHNPSGPTERKGAFYTSLKNGYSMHAEKRRIALADARGGKMRSVE